MRRFAALLLVPSWLACGAPPCPPPAAPAPATSPATEPEPTPTATPPADLARWRAIKAANGAVPGGGSAADELAGLVELLADVDPEARDALGYEIAVLWVGDDQLLGDEGVRQLARLLRGRLRVAIDRGESDASYGRSFAALALSVIAARDARAPVLPDDELTALVDDIGWYAAHETDLRGHTGKHGWLHAAAHTADLLKFLARNPRLDPPQKAKLLDAVASLVTRRHGYILHHGEDARLAAPVLELLARDAIDAPRFESWVRRLVAPLLEKSDGFDRGLYAAQRNARNLLFTLVASIELREERSATMSQARDILLRVLRGG